ncbi:hypothetical protein QJS10_CPA02g00891 [Acorus calamus]|uniref:D-alanine--D-alanine ligase C-terminal domain-containing protein n=1 Tax=Acorus calamus TaxID=4465 RepID=A0AAV9FA74_ACOCL|nr:hypothetical protein QJS10_CPA02g00891 [Acorus calamus]
MVKPEESKIAMWFSAFHSTEERAKICRYEDDRNEEALQKCKQHIEIVANTLGLEGFSRIDAFVNVHTGEVMVIEVNIVPVMTPSTILIHQALSEQPPMYPQQFFRTVLDLALQRSK